MGNSEYEQNYLEPQRDNEIAVPTDYTKLWHCFNEIKGGIPKIESDRRKGHRLAEELYNKSDFLLQKNIMKNTVHLRANSEEKQKGTTAGLGPTIGRAT